jgi:hypothetical protein
MNQSPIGVYFFIPPGYGRPLSGKHSRRFEIQGFECSAAVRRVRRAGQAELIYMRNIPEHTSDRRRAALERSLASYPHARVLNHPDMLSLNGCKEQAFAIWQSMGLSTPQYQVCETAEDVVRFASSTPQLLIRRNNAEAGQDTELLEQPSRQTIEDAFLRIRRTLSTTGRRGRSDSKVVAIQLLDTRGEHQLHRLYRAFIVGARVIGGYALVSKSCLVKADRAAFDDDQAVQMFFDENARLEALLDNPGFNEKLVGATKAVGADLACIDFVPVGNELFFLEANPLWGPAPVWGGGARSLYEANPELWHRRVPRYCQWMDRITFYRRLYDSFDQFVS